MLVLLSFGLVLVATVLLVLGLVSDSGGLTLIYLSIASSLVAGVLLFLSYTKLGAKPAVATGAVETTPSAPPAPAPAPAASPTPPPVVDEAAFAPEPNPATAATGVVPAESVADDDFFPIADYDELTEAQILPLLPELYADEVEVVAERERAGQARPEILGRLAELRDRLEGAPADATGASLAAMAPAVTTTEVPAVSAKKKAPAKKAPAKKAPVKKAVAPAKKAPAKKAPAKKVVAPAPAKKAAAKKTVAKKAVAKKTVAKKTAAPAKKATKATKKR